MLDFLINAVYYSALTVSQVSLQATQDVAPQEMHAVVAVEFKAVSFVWSDVHNCRFTGVAVPVERDWEETVDNGFVKTVRPPEPGKLYTYGIIINRKICPGKDVEPMFNTGSWTGAFANLGLPKGIQFMAIGLSKDEARRPKWLPQAMKAIQDAAGSNEVAKDFISFNTAVAKENAAKAEAAAQAKSEVATQAPQAN